MTTGNYKVGNEFLPYHASASHVRSDFRDGWNACFAEAAIRITELQAQPAIQADQLKALTEVVRLSEEMGLYDNTDAEGKA